MNISHLGGFFHDGSLINIRHINDHIEIFLISSPIREGDNRQKIELSTENCISGKPHLLGVKSITENSKKIQKQDFKMRYDSGIIGKLDQNGNQIILNIIWENFPPKSEINDFSAYEIVVERVYWENPPNLEDPF